MAFIVRLKVAKFLGDMLEIKFRIDKLWDVEKQTKAMTALFRLGDLLGVSDFQRIE